MTRSTASHPSARTLVHRRNRLDRLGRLLAVTAVVVLGPTLLPAAPAAAAPPRIGAGFFGMHDHDPVSWPIAPVGSVRLWDSGVSWREIETTAGVFDFTRLDGQIAAAKAHGSSVLLVLGQTPRFHSTRPTLRGAYGAGAVSMPTEASWKSYLLAVVNRYKGQGLAYQVWNEANVPSYWRGTAAQMARLTQLASTVINRNDRSATVVSPALATRLTGQRAWLRTFYATRVGGKRVAAYVDAVSLNLYPSPSGGPESSMTLLAASRIMLRAAGVRKPIWNTEINYGLLGGPRAKKVTADRAAGYVSRTLILNAAAGVTRLYWYAWDLQKLANTTLSSPDGTTLTKAGTAWTTTRGWLLGARVSACSSDSRGTYTCVVRGPKGFARIYWNPFRTVQVRTVSSARGWTSTLGITTVIKGGKQLAVGRSPILVRSAR